MPIHKFYLNSDKSIEGILTEENKLIYSSNHKNTRNVNNLINNLNAISTTSIDKLNSIISLNNKPFIQINNKTGNVKNLEELTSFETRLFSQSKNTQFLPFRRFNIKPKQLQTDLHTHFAGALTPDQLIECAVGHDVNYPKWLVDKLKLNVKDTPQNDDGSYSLENIIANKRNYDLLVSGMKIDTSEQETFNKMEEIYTARSPITKKQDLFIPLLKAIASDAKNNGIKYMELSLSSVISNINEIKLLEENMPNIEKETGVQIRFLGALWRHSDKEWNSDEVDRLKVMSKSPYIVGCDVMGHETNPTNDFYDELKELATHAMQNDPNFVIRVHAGENALFKNNVRQVLLAVEEAHFELQKTTGKKFDYPQVRIGHGIYGLNEEPSWDENDRTKQISTLELFKKVKPIIEFNMSSNLSLNNIDSLREIPIKDYVNNGIQVVLGTDGRGIYSTSIVQEMVLAHEAGLSFEDFKKISLTEEKIINKAKKRYLKLKANKSLKLESELQNCYKDGLPKYTKEVEQKHKQELIECQNRLKNLISSCGAITNLNEIEKDILNKKPILLSGSSHKHFPKIAENPMQLTRIRVALQALVNAVDPNKAYFVTGGTNHGIEKELHIIANEFNKTHDNRLVVLGTLTEEAALNSLSSDPKLRDTNKIEPNTITHAITPTVDGKIAKRWFDLPDTVLNMVQEKDGCMVAIGGGVIVGDMIQRAHNLGLNMNIMSNVEGASGTKSISLANNNYDFKDAKELLKKLIDDNLDLLKPDLTEQKIDDLIIEAEKQVYIRSTLPSKGIEINKDKGNKMKETITLYSLNEKEYPNLTKEVEVIEDTANSIDEIASKDVIKAKKVAIVQARMAKVGEIVDTRPRVLVNGNMYTFSETKQVISEDKVSQGAIIVTNPDGEEYVIKNKEKFDQKYQQCDGGYMAVDGVKPFRIATKDCAINTSWGEKQYVLKGSALCVQDEKDIYSVTNAAFEKTYSTDPHTILNCQNEGMKR